MSLNNTLKVVCVSAVVVAAVYMFCRSKPNSIHKSYNDTLPFERKIINTSMQPVNSRYFKNIETSNGLPIACVSTLGGDIMMCPSSGVCPLNGERCQPKIDLSNVWTGSQPCCTDHYPPNEIWYYPDMPPSDLSYR
jgi:hypothetical protein